MSRRDPNCEFCVIPAEPLLTSERFWAKLDPYPVSPGHFLVAPIEHVDSLFDLTANELTEAYRLMRQGRRIVHFHHRPDGWNFGVNDGVAAGRTIHHLHFHLIPRYVGDVADPRGGVRNLMPNAPHPDAWSARPLIFEEPPERLAAEPADWAAIGHELSTKPNEWVRATTYPTRGSAATVAYQINRGHKHSTLFRYGRFQAKSRTVEGEHRLYLRWIGHPGAVG